jgi:hypothetical protein
VATPLSPRLGKCPNTSMGVATSLMSLSTKWPARGEIEQVSAQAAALCRLGDHELLRGRGLDMEPVVMSPPPKAQVKGLEWDPQRLRKRSRALREST